MLAGEVAHRCVRWYWWRWVVRNIGCSEQAAYAEAKRLTYDLLYKREADKLWPEIEAQVADFLERRKAWRRV